jgi:hypothetical protein
MKRAREKNLSGLYMIFAETGTKIISGTMNGRGLIRFSTKEEHVNIFSLFI